MLNKNTLRLFSVTRLAACSVLAAGLCACAQQAPAPVIAGFSSYSQPASSSGYSVAEETLPTTQAPSDTPAPAQVHYKHNQLDRDLFGNHDRDSGVKVIKAAEADDTSTPTGAFHDYKVQRGDNLFRIGLKYSVSPLDIMAANNLARPQDLMAGTNIHIPVPAGEGRNAADTGTSSLSGPPDVALFNQIAARAKGFIWPVKGHVVSTFGSKGQGYINSGIEIAVKNGAPVYAAETGTVIYADNGLKSYGNLILMRHRNGLITAYAHNSRLMVKAGQKIKKGQLIALAGMTGNVTTPTLHFEVRRHARAIDPLKVLPPQQTAKG